jgi:hypothetical protein
MTATTLSITSPLPRMPEPWALHRILDVEPPAAASVETGRWHMKFLRFAVVACLAATAVAMLPSIASGRHAGVRESRADLGDVVVQHIAYLLADRFDPAWARIHPVDRRAIGRSRWEQCKRSSGSVEGVRYLGVDVVSSRSVRFSSRLHSRITAVAITVEVRATLQRVPFTVKGVSYWVMKGGRWSRLVEQRKLEAYAAGGCPG